MERMGSSPEFGKESLVQLADDGFVRGGVAEEEAEESHGKDEFGLVFQLYSAEPERKGFRNLNSNVLESRQARSVPMETKLIDVKKENMPLKKLLELVSSGIEVVLTEGKSPVARLLPVSRKVKAERVPGLSAGKIWISSDFDDLLPDEFWLGEGII